MEKTSVRLPPETFQMLEREARKQGEIRGESVTVSDVIRACILEKFPVVSAAARRENTILIEVKEGSEVLARDVEKLVKILSEVIPHMATREQVNELTEGIAAVIRALKER
ncbi:MAG TPA: hypothetical protein VJ550_05625 [Geomonas sp.]|nr:hypothetical protein [Geomonas sp.]